MLCVRSIVQVLRDKDGGINSAVIEERVQKYLDENPPDDTPSEAPAVSCARELPAAGDVLSEYLFSGDILL